MNSTHTPVPWLTRVPWFALILLAYFVLATLFAVYTPAWQAPDEPAHYNYIRYLVSNARFPVLQMGDYPQAYMQRFTDSRYTAGLSIDPIRYEFHQPPLYYVLAAPLFAAVGGALLPLRLFSVLLGAGIVLMAYRAARRFFPACPAPALAAAAFVAFLPQHLATVSQVGNDVLAELLFALTLLLLIGWLDSEGRAESLRPGPVLLLGFLLGLVLVTKTTAYIAVPLAGGVLLWRWFCERASARRVAAELALVALPAAVIALPWYVRDLSVYGWPDFLGLGRHDAIVVGQLRTSEFLAQSGVRAYLDRLATFTFDSFWGVFGWLGVFMDARIYNALAIFTAIVAGGLVAAGARAPRTLQRATAPAVVLLAVSALLTLLVYGWYNLQFVQHQGRYLFTALIPLALAIAYGWEAALDRRHSRWLAVALVVLAAAQVAWARVGGGGLPKWPLVFALTAAAFLFVRPWLPRRLDGWLYAAPYLILPVLALYALFGAIVPQLART